MGSIIETSGEPLIEFSGVLSLEGPFLEMVWAALQLTKGVKVVPRHESLGTRHDVLVQHGSQSVLYECTGQADMTSEKINRLRSESFELADKLMKLNEPPLREVVLVSATLRDSWSEKSRTTFENAQKDIKNQLNVKLVTIQDYDVLLQLVESGVLGIKLIDNKIHFTGSEEYAIRYSPGKKCFEKGFHMNMQAFHELPQSFFPSHYWEQKYQKLVQESMEGKEEPLPIPWSYPFQVGVTWSSKSHMKRACLLSLQGVRRYPMIEDDHGFVELYESARGNEYYGVHVFEEKDQVSKDTMSGLKGYAMELVRATRNSHEYLEGRIFGVYIHTSSESWSPLAWSEAHNIYRKDVDIRSLEKGEDFLLQLLNTGTLGFTFREKNQITLAGSKKAVRKTDRGLKITETPR